MDPRAPLHPPIVAYATPEPRNKDSRTNLGASASHAPPPPWVQSAAPLLRGNKPAPQPKVVFSWPRAPHSLTPIYEVPKLLGELVL